MSLPARPLATRPAEAIRRLLTITDGTYALEADEAGSYFYVEHVRRDRNGEMRCTMTVKCALAGVYTLEDGTLQVFDNFNLSDLRARQAAAADLRRLTGQAKPDVGWQSLVDDLALKVRRAEQTGGGSVLLADQPRSPAEDVFLVDGLPFPKHQPTTWGAYGDTGKSLLALHAAGRLSQMGVRPLFVDYEMDQGEHRNRLESLFGNEMPMVRYMRATRPLVHQVDRLINEIHTHQINYLMVDSIGPAVQGKLTDEEGALGYFNAIRGTGLGVLSLAHLPKQREGTTDDNTSIFGSVFFFNLSRSVWHLKQATEAATDDSITVAFFHKKNNLGRKLSPLGFELRFEGDRPRVRRVDLSTVESLAAKMPLQQRMKLLLKRGPRSIEDLAAELDAKPDTLKRTIRRFSGDDNKFAMFVRVPDTDGTDRIGLLERRIA